MLTSFDGVSSHSMGLACGCQWSWPPGSSRVLNSLGAWASCSTVCGVFLDQGVLRQGCPVLQRVSCAEWVEGVSGGEGSTSECSPSKGQGLPNDAASQRSSAKCSVYCLMPLFELGLEFSYSGLCKPCLEHKRAENAMPPHPGNPWSSWDCPRPE